MGSFYEDYGKRYKACKDDAIRAKARKHWEDAYKEAVEKGHSETAVFSAQLIAVMDIIDKGEVTVC